MEISATAEPFAIGNLKKPITQERAITDPAGAIANISDALMALAGITDSQERNQWNMQQALIEFIDSQERNQ